MSIATTASDGVKVHVNDVVDVHVAVDVKVLVKVIVEDKVNLATKQRRRGATGST